MKPGSDATTERRAHALLRRAIDLAPEDRARFVDDESGTDLQLRDETRRLLVALNAAGEFLERPAWEPAPSDAHRFVGRKVGEYRILGHAASGGMGDVFRAEQESPRRTVAIKCMRAGHASPTALARFALEADALGRLQHPNVAQVLSSGTFDFDGENASYMALEWLENARTITRWAVESNASQSQRLEAFLEVCAAISHAHGRGVIHRDLKPGNILVAADGRAKVIDFGIALLRGGDRVTRDGQFVGTLGSMAPEQWTDRADALDVRTDVYGLGVTLYELLEDRPPFEIASLPIADAMRMIRDEPPRAMNAADHDLALVVTTALAKQPSDRYASVEALSRDIRNVLQHRPIEAKPPSISRRVRLFARRHRTAVAAAAFVSTAVIVGSVATSVGFVRASQAEATAQRRLAKLSTLTDFLRSMFDVDESWAIGPDTKVVDQVRAWEARVAEGFDGAPDVRAAVHYEIGRAFTSLGEYADARRHLTEAEQLFTATFGEESPDAVRTRGRLAHLDLRESKFAESDAAYATLVPLARRVLGPAEYECQVIESDSAMTKHALGRHDDAALLLESVLERRRATLPADSVRLAATIGQLGRVQAARGKIEEAERCYREAIAIEEKAFGSDSLASIAAKNNLAVLLRTQNRLDEAEPLTRQAFETRRAKQGPDHPDTLTTQTNLAMQLVARKKFEAALPLLEDAAERHRRVLGPKHMGTIITCANLAAVCLDLDRVADAEATAARLIVDIQAALGEDHWRVAWARAIHGAAIGRQGRLAEGRAELDAAITTLAGAKGPNPGMVDRARGWRAALE